MMLEKSRMLLEGWGRGGGGIFIPRYPSPGWILQRSGNMSSQCIGQKLLLLIAIHMTPAEGLLLFLYRFKHISAKKKRHYDTQKETPKASNVIFWESWRMYGKARSYCKTFNDHPIKARIDLEMLTATFTISLVMLDSTTSNRKTLLATYHRLLRGIF